MRRNSIFEGIQKETELVLRLLLGEAQHLEHLGLDVVLMDSDAAAADLGTVEGDVVSFRTDSARIGVDLVQILFHGHGKRMVHGNETVLLL